MSKTTILELRQKDSSDVERNGIYTTNLSAPIQIEEGDQVNVKAIYLDTSESAAGFIHLEDPVNVDMEMCMYLQNFNEDQQYRTNVSDTLTSLRFYPNIPVAGNRTIQEKGDNSIWWLAQHQETVGNKNWMLNGVKLVPLPGATTFGPIDIQMNYTPIQSGATETQTTILSFKKKVDIKTAPAGLIYPVRVIGKGDGDGGFFSLYTSQAELKAKGLGAVTFDEFDEPVDPGKPIFNLQRFPLKFTIPAGDYTPGEIASIVTDNMANLESTSNVSDVYTVTAAQNPATKTQWPAMSPFLTTILKNDKELQNLATAEGTTIGQAFVNQGNYISPDGTNNSGKFYMTYNLAGMRAEFDLGEPDPTNFNPPLDKYVGANQAGLIFNPATNKLEFNLHFPIYVNESDPAKQSNDAQPGVRYNAIFNEFNLDVFSIPTGMPLRYSGVAFTKLEPQSFWTGALGFNNPVVTEIHDANLKFPTNLDNEFTNNSFTITPINGVNITGAFPSLDVGVIKSQTRYSTPPFSNLTSGEIDISNPAIWSISSVKTYNNDVAAEGYFLVDVSPNFKQNLIGGTGTGQNSNSTQSIVNRYYTENSFTSDQGAGSINYTHTGAPEMLSNFQVRVLNPDRSNVDPHVLQDKNTVFIEVIKKNTEN